MKSLEGSAAYYFAACIYMYLSRIMFLRRSVADDCWAEMERDGQVSKFTPGFLNVQFDWCDLTYRDRQLYLYCTLNIRS